MASSKKLTTVSKLTFLLSYIVLLLLLLRHATLPPQSNSAFSAPKPARASRGFKEWLFEQERRKAKIARACGNKTKERNNDKLSLLFNEEHNLLFCFQPKVRLLLLLAFVCDGSFIQVGSTTWLNHFISLEERSVQEKLATLRRDERVQYLAPKGQRGDIANLANTSISISMVWYSSLRYVMTDTYF